ncbi:hypothetical protein AWJ20_4848 [Sugiyamaella lignohabitans]|uniref:Uncharacterized protein n=1 Tax=Sugiyamaella lignohabitans TaxID=796027 RepID=A0A161HL24_9ASCO|nr:uncharacterized protein AWJ20_4848 [Sugiyamaella lignohabitans]ANB13897.1 hypothetical protein AWJ20_4848 [Sugiyamaella lignohabitans]
MKDAGTDTSLDMVVTEVFEIAPKSTTISYNKEVQTSEDWASGTNTKSASGIEDYDEFDYSVNMAQRKQLEDKIRTELEELYKKENEEVLKNNRTLSNDEPGLNANGTPDVSRPTILSDKEASQISARQDFENFWSQSWKVINRAAEEDTNYNILRNYAESQNSDAQQQSRNSLTEITHLYSKDSVGRAVTYIDWSPKFPELIAAAYTEKSSDPHATKGLIQIFNLHAPNQPEYTLTAQSDILVVKFSPFDSNLIFGAAYNGQVLAWDLRSKGSRPLLSSQLSGKAHTHPVYSLEIIGTQNAYTLITASTDGTVCTWTPDMLAKPQEKITLQTNSSSLRNDEAAPTSLAIPTRDQAQFLIGTEEGAIYQCYRFGQAGSRPGIDHRKSYRGHTGPVTSVDLHPSSGPVDFGNYLLSSGNDWSIKIWLVSLISSHGSNLSSTASSAPANRGEIIRPILDIKRDDVVYDISWNPNHPSIFAAVDGTGHVEVWNLLTDTEVPVVRAKPSNIEKNIVGSNYLKRPLNRVSWEKTSEARRLAVGGLNGSITILELDTTLIGSSPKPEHWAQLKRLFEQLES